MLHAIERKGYLISREEQRGSTRRKLYRATGLGREGLAVAWRQLMEFTDEAIREDEVHHPRDEAEPAR